MPFEHLLTLQYPSNKCLVSKKLIYHCDQNFNRKIIFLLCQQLKEESATKIREDKLVDKK